MATNAAVFTDDTFEQDVLNAQIPVLVDFWAEWCGPCKMMTPVIEEVAENFASRASVGKLDTEANRDTAMKYGISAIPTLILFVNGEPVRKFIGLQTKQALVEAIEEHLS